MCFLFSFIEKKYTGFIKLKQNWDDGLRKKTNPKTLILAGNIESAVGHLYLYTHTLLCACMEEVAVNKNSFESFFIIRKYL